MYYIYSNLFYRGFEMYNFEKKFRPKLILFLILFLALFSLSANAKEPYNEYCNARFRFCVQYPANFGKGPAPVNNDGRDFYDNDGFYMTASGMHNVLNNSLQAERKSQEEDFDRITYRVSKKHFFVLSGYDGEDILYIKTYIGKDFIYHLYIRYPSNRKHYYDRYVSKISKSFRPGPLVER